MIDDLPTNHFTDNSLIDKITQLETRLKDNNNQHREIETVIERGKQEWEATFDAVNDLIILTDNEGNIIRCNRSTTQRFHKTYTDLIGSNIDNLFFGTTQHDPMIFEGEIHTVRFPLLDGWFNIASYPVSVKNKPFGVVHVVSDITEQINVQDSLRQSRKNSAKSMMILKTVSDSARKNSAWPMRNYKTKSKNVKPSRMF